MCRIWLPAALFRPLFTDIPHDIRLLSIVNVPWSLIVYSISAVQLDIYSSRLQLHFYTPHAMFLINHNLIYGNFTWLLVTQGKISSGDINEAHGRNTKGKLSGYTSGYVSAIVFIRVSYVTCREHVNVSKSAYRKKLNT